MSSFIARPFARSLPRRPALRVTLLAVAAVLLAACGDSATAPSSDHRMPETTSTPTPVVPPTITLTAQSATTNTGGSCLLFYAKSTEDLTVFTGKLVDPLDRTTPVDPASGQAFVMGQGRLAALQRTGICYQKLSGTYTFTFTGARASGGSFTATATYVQGSV